MIPNSLMKECIVSPLDVSNNGSDGKEIVYYWDLWLDYHEDFICSFYDVLLSLYHEMTAIRLH